MLSPSGSSNSLVGSSFRDIYDQRGVLYMNYRCKEEGRLNLTVKLARLEDRFRFDKYLINFAEAFPQERLVVS